MLVTFFLLPSRNDLTKVSLFVFLTPKVRLQIHRWNSVINLMRHIYLRSRYLKVSDSYYNSRLLFCHTPFLYVAISWCSFAASSFLVFSSACDMDMLHSAACGLCQGCPASEWLGQKSESGRGSPKTLGVVAARGWEDEGNCSWEGSWEA